MSATNPDFRFHDCALSLCHCSCCYLARGRCHCRTVHPARWLSYRDPRGARIEPEHAVFVGAEVAHTRLVKGYRRPQAITQVTDHLMSRHGTPSGPSEAGMQYRHHLQGRAVEDDVEAYTTRAARRNPPPIWRGFGGATTWGCDGGRYSEYVQGRLKTIPNIYAEGDNHCLNGLGNQRNQR
jgi:hypothetical protein